jgi:cytochrome P450
VIPTEELDASFGREDLPDLADAAFYTSGEHWAIWKKARRERPLFWCESPSAGGFWSVVTHALANQVLKQPGVFTSAGGMRLGGNPAAVRFASGKMLTVSDGSRHQRIRAVHAPWFNSRAMAKLRDSLQDRLDTHVHQLVERGQAFDAVALARQFPAWTVFEMMGVPAQDWENLGALTDAAYNEAHDGPTVRAAQAEVLWYFSRLVEERRSRPSDDIVSALMHTDVQNGSLSDDEVLLNCDGLLTGGLETTQHAASGAIELFARQPAIWEQLRHQPALADAATEELLRWTSPAMHVLRTAVADASIGDQRITSGERIAVWIPSCNRDESVFAAPDDFLVDRHPNPHLAFSVGPHYCIGAPLARLELGCYLRALARHVSQFEVVGAPVRLKSAFLNGLERLEVRLHRS